MKSHRFGKLITHSSRIMKRITLYSIVVSSFKAAYAGDYF
jgi:hypothetical protein